ncbi:MAG: helix-turn-helix domain-containing protein [Bacteroidales bacterium]
MIDRIALLLKAKNISASQFADEIGVQRSSISHVLSGRNKPSLEFVQKILKRYPEINPDWILFGKGPMNMEYNLFSELNESIPVREEIIDNVLKKQEHLIRPVAEEEQFSAQAPATMNTRKEEPVKPAPIAAKTESIQPIEQEPVKQQEQLAEQQIQAVKEKSIEKVLVFFNNRTFREYSPE